MRKGAWWILALAARLALPAGAATQGEAAEVAGLMTPLGETSVSILNAAGRTEVRWADKTKVVLSINWRQLGDVPGVIRHPILFLEQVVEYKVPPGAMYAVKTVRPREAEAGLKAAREAREITAFNLRIQAAPVPDHLPTKDEPFYAGRFAFARGRGKPATLTVGEQTFAVRMRRGQAWVLVCDVATIRDCKPYVTKARVTGRKIDGAIVADEVRISPVGDQAAADDPKLPRMLVIGDSISINYLRPLREALKGKVNVHHPPTNCGRSAGGARNVAVWMGDYRAKGRQWDVISFNFGHWDSGNTKPAYQKSLKTVVAALKKTGAKLIWVTTCPVPDGCGKAGELGASGKAPGRKAGVMARYVNPWALEVMKRHGEIAVCDQWQLVRDNAGGLYTDWWKGDNVHFRGPTAEALGRLLARRALEALQAGRTPRQRE